MPGDSTPSITQRDHKVNCWEFMGCGREPGGQRVAEMGVCPAAIESRLDGVLGGSNGGRCCWIVAGTFCRGEIQGTFARRYATCKECEFFRLVQTEESPFLWHADSLLLYLSSTEAEERDRLFRVLSQMIDPSVIRSALTDVGALERGAEKHVTAFFSDITGFSTISGQLDPTRLADFLNEYLSAMTRILKAEGGTLDKLVGDGIVGMFGAPACLENDALAAARAALAMQARLASLREEWRARRAWCPGAWSLQMRIGLSSGLAKVGLMGATNFGSYTMTGASVNLAKWLERSCKTYGVPILVSEATRDLIAGEMLLRRIGTVHPKGHVGVEAIYQLLAPRSGASPEVLRSVEIYEAALDLHDHGEWGRAAQLLRRSMQTGAAPDRTAERLLHRCESLDAPAHTKRAAGPPRRRRRR